MSAPLAEIIRTEIFESGPMTFRRFMELALYHPEHGYYASGRAQVGRGGDFFTNVSVGPLFGKLLARQFAQMWELLDSPDVFTIVEQGAHEGHFAHDVCTAMQEISVDCFAALRYCIVEPSARLADMQRVRLKGFPVTWVDSVNAVAPFVGVHFSNELVDAFPVHVVKWNGSEWLERYVISTPEGFEFSDGVLSSSALTQAIAMLPNPGTFGYTTEINLAATCWIQEVAEVLERGYVLAVDYGYLAEEYYSPERTEGTLSAYAKHRREPDPLREPGAIDLTAHVDFSALMKAGEKAGLGVVGYTDQHHFMVGLGSMHFTDGAQTGDLRAFQTLMHPTMMGLAFKVVALEKEAPTPLTGFRFARPLDHGRRS